MLAAYPEPWAPAEPVDVEALTLTTMFVIAEHSAVCPKRRQAEQRACGHSVESADQGLRLVRGQSVEVVGEAPFDGHWRAVRHQVDGPLPGWIRADDVSARPRMAALDEFDAREDVGKARSVDAMTGEEVHALGPGRLVSWTRVRGVDLGDIRSFHPDDANPGVVIYVPTRGGTPVAVKLREDPADYAYLGMHDALHLYGGMDLDYVCERGGHCDEVSILARTRGDRAGPPRDDEGEWPDAWKGYVMPALDAVVVADRFGVWEFDAPTR